MGSDRPDLNPESGSPLLNLKHDSAVRRFRLTPSCFSQGRRMAFDHLDEAKFTDERTAVADALAARPLNGAAREAVRAAADGFVCSFDMLGEGARTEADAERYEAAYAAALKVVGKHASKTGPEAGHGVSVKLSALSPRYDPRQPERVWGELYPRIKRL